LTHSWTPTWHLGHRETLSPSAARHRIRNSCTNYWQSLFHQQL